MKVQHTTHNGQTLKHYFEASNICIQGQNKSFSNRTGINRHKIYMFSRVLLVDLKSPAKIGLIFFFVLLLLHNLSN